MKHKITGILLILIVAILLPVGAFAQESGFESPSALEMDEFQLDQDYGKGIIRQIYEERLNQELSAGIYENYQRVLVEITAGRFKGEVIMVDNSFINSPGYEILVKNGDRVLLTTLYDSSGLQKAYIVDFVRDRYIYMLGILFAVLMLIIGRKQGIKGLVSLAVTFWIIYKFMIPQIFQGRDPVIIAVLSSAIIALITFAIVSGLTKKSLSAFLGTAAGVLVAALLAIIISDLGNLTGLSTEDARMLYFVPGFDNVNMRGILLAGIILGALGAVMDVCMSIASSIDEICCVGEKMTFRSLFKSGMNVGNDIMGTMTNTLVLAYTGASLPLLLLILAYDQPFLQLINFEMLADEIIRAMIGTISLVLAIPITAGISALLLGTRKDA